VARQALEALIRAGRRLAAAPLRDGCHGGEAFGNGGQAVEVGLVSPAKTSARAAPGGISPSDNADLKGSVQLGLNPQRVPPHDIANGKLMRARPVEGARLTAGKPERLAPERGS